MNDVDWNKVTITGAESTESIIFIPQWNVPVNRKLTYAPFVCDHQLLKDGRNRGFEY